MASRAVPGLSARLGDLPVVRGHAPWPGHEYARGWGVFALPFDSGHVLVVLVPTLERRLQGWLRGGARPRKR